MNRKRIRRTGERTDRKRKFVWRLSHVPRYALSIAERKGVGVLTRIIFKLLTTRFELFSKDSIGMHCSC